jgi:hypothetical protein
MTDKLLECFEPIAFRSARSALNLAGEVATLDVGAKLKDMW